jgi:uncharacterized protein
MQGSDKLSVKEVSGGAVIAVKAVPGSSRDRIAGVLGERLKINVSAAAEKGKANLAIAAVLAEALDVPPRNVTLVGGPTRPVKEFFVAGLAAIELRRRLAAL